MCFTFIFPDYKRNASPSADGQISHKPSMAGRGRPRSNPARGRKAPHVQFSDPLETTQSITADQMLSQPPAGSVPKTKGKHAESASKPAGLPFLSGLGSFVYFSRIFLIL